MVMKFWNFDIFYKICYILTMLSALACHMESIYFNCSQFCVCEIMDPLSAHTRRRMGSVVFFSEHAWEILSFVKIKQSMTSPILQLFNVSLWWIQICFATISSGDGGRGPQASIVILIPNWWWDKQGRDVKGLFCLWRQSVIQWTQLLS